MLRDPRQELVAGGVAEPVVQPLEVVDVDQQDRERLAGALDALDLAREVVLEEAVVVQLGEAVGDRELFSTSFACCSASFWSLSCRLVSSISVAVASAAAGSCR